MRLYRKFPNMADDFAELRTASSSESAEEEILEYNAIDFVSDSDEDMDTDDQPSCSNTTGNLNTKVCDDDEDDETIRAMIAAINKPSSAPPDIKSHNFVTDICFHPERDVIALASIIGDVDLYKYSNEGNEKISTIELHSQSCRDAEFTDDGLFLVTCSSDKAIMITDIQTEALVQFYDKGHDDSINKIHIYDEHLFATGDDEGLVNLWDIRVREPTFSLKLARDMILSMYTDEDNKYLVVSSSDGFLKTINLPARKLYVESESYKEELTCMAAYRNDSKLVVGTSVGRLYTFNMGQFGYHSDMFPAVKTPLSTMVPITNRIGCVAGEEGIIRAIHIAPFSILGVIGQHKFPVEALDINHNGELIASSSHNNDVAFWNIKYFEDFEDLKSAEKRTVERDRTHNLPSSKFSNASDFFSNLAE